MTTDTLRKLAEAATPLRRVDLDIEKRLADHAFAIEWSNAQDESIAALEKEIDALRAKVKRQAEALKPFSEFEFAPTVEDGMILRMSGWEPRGRISDFGISDWCVPCITVGDLRRAAQEAGNE